MPGLSGSGDYNQERTGASGPQGPQANSEAEQPDPLERSDPSTFDFTPSRVAQRAHERISELDNPTWAELAIRVQHHQLENHWNDELCLIVLAKLPALLKTGSQIQSLERALSARIDNKQSLEDLLIAAFSFARAEILPEPQDLENLASFREQIRLNCPNTPGRMLDICETDGPRIAVGQRAREVFEFSARLMEQIDKAPDTWCIKPESIILHATRFNRIARDLRDFTLINSVLSSTSQFERYARDVYEQTVAFCESMHSLEAPVRQVHFENLGQALETIASSDRSGYFSRELLQGTLNLTRRACSPDLIKLFQQGLCQFVQHEKPPSIAEWFRVVSALAEDNIHEQLRKNVTQLLTGVQNREGVQFKELIGEIAAHALVSSIGRNQLREGSQIAQLRELTESSHIGIARKIFGRLPKIASFKLLEEDSQLDPAQRFQLERMLRHYEVHHGFGALLHECRRLPDGSPSLFECFASDIGRVSGIKWSSKGTFPESGFFIEQIEPARFLVSDPRTPANPFHHYKTAWPLYRREIDHLQNAQFILSRGFIAILPPADDPRALLELRPGQPAHFSLLIFNDHFKNPETRVAYLVETKALRNLLSNPDSMPEGIEELLKFCSKDMPAINVGQARSVTQMIDIGDSLKELYREQRRKTFELIRSYREERHPIIRILPLPAVFKNFLRDSSQARAEQAIDGQIQKLQLLERDIRQQTVAASSLALVCHNYLDLMRIGYSNWKKGQTLKNSPKRSQQTHEASSGTDNGEKTSDIFMSLEDSNAKPQALRMLQEAYRWHHLGHAHNLPADDFPIIKVGNPLSYWNAAFEDMALDTFDLSLRIGGTYTQLSRNSAGPSGADKVEWAMSIMPIAADLPNQFRSFCLSSRDKSDPIFEKW